MAHIINNNGTKEVSEASNETDFGQINPNIIRPSTDTYISGSKPRVTLRVPV